MFVSHTPKYLIPLGMIVCLAEVAAAAAAAVEQMNISQRAENRIQNIQTLAGCLGNAAGLSDSDNMLHQNTTVLM